MAMHISGESIGSNSIFYKSCTCFWMWVRNRCSKIKGRLKSNPSFNCNTCTSSIIAIPQDDPEVIIRNDKYEVVDSFCYLGDSIGLSESCFEATTERVRVVWKNFHSFLLVRTNSGIPLKVWAVKVDDIHWLVRNDNTIKKITMPDLRTYMGISSIKYVIRCNCLYWFGYLQYMDEEKCLRKILNFKVNVSPCAINCLFMVFHVYCDIFYENPALKVIISGSP